MGHDVNSFSPQIRVRVLEPLISLGKLKRVKQTDNRPENRIKVYQINPVTLNDGRQTIFEVWQQRDEIAVETR